MDNAITHLAAAVAKIGNYQMPMRMNETTRTFFARLAKISPPDEAYLYTHLEDPKESAAVQEKIRATNIGYNSMLRTSIVPTIIKVGFRSNVIPADAEATLDVRALPDEDIDAMVTTLRQLINDPAVEVIPPGRQARPGSAPSRLDSEMFKALERTQSKMFPGAVTLPIMLTGATDSAQLRAKGVQAYGLGSVVTDEERARIHGNDERLSVAGIGKFAQLVYQATADVAAAK
jgi:acetylornithine deacetylase/succinyl-diaminopimelate desuccinylase-like protein